MWTVLKIDGGYSVFDHGGQEFFLDKKKDAIKLKNFLNRNDADKNSDLDNLWNSCFEISHSDGEVEESYDE